MTCPVGVGIYLKDSDKQSSICFKLKFQVSSDKPLEFSLANTSYSEIPSYTSPTSGNKFQLRDVIDFRPKRIGIETAIPGSSTANKEINDITSTSNVFSSKILPDFDHTFDTDYAHYIPRKDKIVLTRDRNFKVIKGVSDVNPVLPPDDEELTP